MKCTLNKQVNKRNKLAQNKFVNLDLWYILHEFKEHVFACLIASDVSDSETLWTVVHQSPLSIGFSRQEYWSGCHPFLQGIFPGKLANLNFLIKILRNLNILVKKILIFLKLFRGWHPFHKKIFRHLPELESYIKTFGKCGFLRLI